MCGAAIELFESRRPSLSRCSELDADTASMSEQSRAADPAPVVQGDLLREIILEVRALADATGHPCMMSRPEIVAQLAEERLLARQREAAERAARFRRSA